MAKGLFAFKQGRQYPEPFDMVTDKLRDVHSKYSSTTKKTKLYQPMLKALLNYCKALLNNEPGAVGMSNAKCLAEYKSASGGDYHVVVYNPDDGEFLASVMTKDRAVNEQYQLAESARDGAAMLLAMIPEFCKDDEFNDNLKLFVEQFKSGFSDLEGAADTACLLFDNVYRRVEAGAVKYEHPDEGKMRQINFAHLDSNTFHATDITAGEFAFFNQLNAATPAKSVEIIAHTDFAEQYHLNPKRNLNAFEAMLVPKLPAWYIIPPEVDSICRHAQLTSKSKKPMRNFLLRGPAGTGKTEGAKAVAAGLGLPYMLHTCSANSEIFDFIGSFQPDTGQAIHSGEQLQEELEVLNKMGGMTTQNVVELLKLPDLDDLTFDPERIYKELTGTKKTGASTQECMKAVMDRVSEKIQELTAFQLKNDSEGQRFQYADTNLIKALEFGYVLELQEPTVIAQQGVLVGLNSLLEQGGKITLPTGRVIERHPDAVVVITTNVDYEGCRGLNQSVIDRMSLIVDVDLPSIDVMVERVMSITGVKKKRQVKKMAQVVAQMAQYCQENAITDGSCGVRSLIDWVMSTMVTDNPYQSALCTVVPRAAGDARDRESLISTSLEPFFPPKN